MTLGIVVIGRNEGERLRVCLDSLVGLDSQVVYVDSGSSDSSVELARSLGAVVVELDTSVPFSAARARNAGFEQLIELNPEIAIVQFVDGDCEVVSGWLDRARAELAARPDAAIVCGRVRERHPDLSIYNRLADLEWDKPIGEIEACGGIFAICAEAFRAVGGFTPEVIAAEDDEICLRLRRISWKVLRIDTDMVLHDMAMTRFGAWWKRSVRTGYAYADVSSRNIPGVERHFIREVRSVLMWGLVLPVVIMALAWPTRGLSLLLLAMYVVLAFRVRRHMQGRGQPANLAGLYAVFCVIAKFPQAIGVLRYSWGQLAGRRSRLIEHKTSDVAVTATRVA